MTTGLITVSFMLRNTSPIGWIPLLFYKVIKEGSLKPFIIAFFIVSLPIIGISVFLDTLYYGGDTITLTSINFLTVNLLDGSSRYFGDDPMISYIFVFMPLIFTVLYPFTFIALVLYYKDSLNKK
jgi:hypothetical protein